MIFIVANTIKLHMRTQTSHLYEAQTPEFGTQNGASFDWDTKLQGAEIVEVTGRNGWYIDQVKVETTDGSDYEHSPSFGGNGGGAYTWRVPAGEHITDLLIRQGDWLDSVTFVTDKGTKSPRFGGNGGSESSFHIPDGYRLSGVFGTVNGYLKSLGFYLSPVKASIPEIKFLPVYGNYHMGNKFEWVWSGNHVDAQLAKIQGRQGWYVDQIRVFLTDGETSPIFGQNGGNAFDISLANDEYVTDATFQTGDWLDSIIFHTNKGRDLKIGGDGGDTVHKVHFGDNEKIVGIYGSNDAYVRSLGFIVSL